MDSSMKARVARGGEFLDDVRPGWRHNVDVSMLTVSSPFCCVLGQLWGEYRDGLEELTARCFELMRDVILSSGYGIGWWYGFDFKYGVHEARRLQELWEEEIRG